MSDAEKTRTNNKEWCWSLHGWSVGVVMGLSVVWASFLVMTLVTRLIDVNNCNMIQTKQESILMIWRRRELTIVKNSWCVHGCKMGTSLWDSMWF